MQITQRLGRFLRRKRKTITILLFLPRKRTSSFFLAVLLRVRAGMLSLYGLYDYVFAYCFVDVRPLISQRVQQAERTISHRIKRENLTVVYKAERRFSLTFAASVGKLNLNTSLLPRTITSPTRNDVQCLVPFTLQ